MLRIEIRKHGSQYMIEQIEVKKTDDGVLLARRLDGQPLTPQDREEAKRIAASDQTPLGDPVANDNDNPVLPVDCWFPHFRAFHQQVITETADFDYGELCERNCELYRRIKTKENEIDVLGPARLSEVIAIMREWRELILTAEFKRSDGIYRHELS
jgi:hypothetical protein